MLVHLKIMAATASCTLEDAVTGLLDNGVSRMIKGNKYLVYWMGVLIWSRHARTHFYFLLSPRGGLTLEICSI